jgi:predicted nuclease of predicted toxin-antitoxin system
MTLLVDMNLAPQWVEAVKAHGRHTALHWSVEAQCLRVRLLPFASAA